MAKQKKRVKKLTSVNKDLTRQVLALHDELAATQADLKTTRRELTKAKEKVAKWKTRAAAAPGSDAPAADPVAVDPEVVETADVATETGAEPARESASGADDDRPAVDTTGEPGPQWTVSQLREEAKRRGLTGHSRSTKQQLLSALDGA